MKNGYTDLVKHWPTSWLVRTYRVTQEIVDRLAEWATRERVGVSDLVRFLLLDGLNRLDAGELDIPTKPEGLRRIDHDKR